VAVERLARGHLDPAFADAVLLDVVALLAVEADADRMLEDRGDVVRTSRIDRESIGQRRQGRRSVFHRAIVGPRPDAACRPSAGRRCARTRRRGQPASRLFVEPVELERLVDALHAR